MCLQFIKLSPVDVMVNVDKQNILFCVQHKKDINTDLGQYVSEQHVNETGKFDQLLGNIRTGLDNTIVYNMSLRFYHDYTFCDIQL